jgi:hypothetical protein
LRGADEGQAAGHDVTLELNAYMRLAEKRHNPIFHYFLDQFGQELIDVFQRMDLSSHLDAARQVNMCSADAARVIFKKSHSPILDFLDRITADILFDIGRMLGMLFDRFSRLNTVRSRKNGS